MALLRVFVSHSSADNAFCQTLVKALRGAGADVWYDDERQRPRTRQLGLITERELRERPVFIVVLSPAALASRWVKDEARGASSFSKSAPGRVILPVLAAPLTTEKDIWRFLRNVKRIEAPDCKPLPPAEAIAQMLHALALTPAAAMPTSSTIPQPVESVEDLLAHGHALLVQQRSAEALPFFERAAQRDPGPHTLAAWVFLGYVSADLGHWQEALAASDRVLNLPSNDTTKWAWYLKGAALSNLRRYQEGLVAYDRALELDPKDAVAWHSKGVALANLHRYAEALAACERAIELDPKDAVAWVLKGAMLRKLWRWRKARAAMRRAKELGWKR